MTTRIINQNDLSTAGFNTVADEWAVSSGLLFGGDGIGGPSTNAIYAAGAAGVLTGSYYYSVSFVTELGETDPWIGTPAKVTLAAQRMNLTNIPIGPSGVIARRIYRCVANEAQDKRMYFLAQISDNVTTTYVDNAEDNTLGGSPNWLPTNLGRISSANGAVVAAGGQSTALGALNQPGYAGIAIGYGSQSSGKAGLRNTSVGVYSLGAVTNGYRNTGLGTHAGNGITTGASNTLIGYGTGGTSGIVGGNFNTALGDSALGSNILTGNGNIAIGYSAMSSLTASVGGCVAVGMFAGKYASGNYQLFIDPTTVDRGSAANAQDAGLDWGQGAITANVKDQRRKINALTRLGSSMAATVADLPAASASLRGFRGHVTDATVAYTSANVGTTVAGGGSNVVPIFCNGTNWVIG